MERLDGPVQALAPDEPHDVEGSAVGIPAQAVDRDDPRMLQAPGDLRLDQESCTALGPIGVPILDLLERHLAVQLAVVGQEYLAQSAARVGPQDPEPGLARVPQA